MDIFQFTSAPFTREFRIDHRLKLDFIEAEVSSLQKVVETRQSGVLLAPPGHGKSVALRSLCSKLPETRYQIVYLKVASLSARDMCRQISTKLGADKSGSYPSLVLSLEDRFRNTYDSGIRPVVIFDDAQDLRPHTIQIVKLLTNFEMDSKLIVSMILVGHPSLRELFNRSDLEDIRQRMVYCGELRSLSREESKSYIKHRLEIVGCKAIPFDSMAIDAVYEITRGNMRLIDTLCHQTLMEASNQKRQGVDAADISIARKNLWI